MKRKMFIKSTAMMAGALIQMPFTPEKNPIVAIDFAFDDSPDSNARFDVILIGGSFAGLSAALGLGRCMRSVLLIDEGLPRNRASSQANNLFSRDGQQPASILTEAKSQLESYKQYLSKTTGVVRKVEAGNNNFVVQTEDGRKYKSGIIVFASGVTDNLLDIKGLQELWGQAVFHCPYCHGWESRGKRAVVIGNGDSAIRLASTLSHWNPDLTYYTQGLPVDLSDSQVMQLDKLGIELQQKKVVEVQLADSGVLVYVDGFEEPIHFETCYAPSSITANSTLAEGLGCELSLYRSISVDEWYKSSVDGVYAIGDVSSRANGQVIHAAYSGAIVAASINNVLLAQRFS